MRKTKTQCARPIRTPAGHAKRPHLPTDRGGKATKKNKKTKKNHEVADSETSDLRIFDPSVDDGCYATPSGSP